MVTPLTADGLRFDGIGYAIIDRHSYDFDDEVSHRMSMQFHFKTIVNNGLMFLVGKGRKFLGIQIEDGYVSLRVSNFFFRNIF